MILRVGELIDKKCEIIIRYILQAKENGTDITEEFIESIIAPYCTEQERKEYYHIINHAHDRLEINSLDKIDNYSLKYYDISGTIMGKKINEILGEKLHVTQYVKYSDKSDYYMDK